MSVTPLPRLSPADAGMSSRAVSDLLDAIGASGYEFHSLMVLHGGAVVVEGWWSPYRAELPHLLYSLSKSFVSSAIGLLIEEGRLRLDDRLVDVLGRWAPSQPTERVAAMTVRSALTMTTGHTVDPIFPMLVWSAEHQGQDWLSGFFDLEPGADPGTVFTYNQLATYSLSRVVSELTGQRVVEYLGPRLFEPLGITDARWLTDGHGHDWGFSGLHLRTEDIARFGLMLLNGGAVEGRQVIGADWLAEATRVQVLNDTAHRAPGDLEANPDWMQGYGYQFWKCRHGYRGDGAHGQFCVVWPDEDVVIVTTGAVEDMQGMLERFEEHLAPGIGVPTPGDDAALAERLGALTLVPAGGDGSPGASVTARNESGGTARRLETVTVSPAGTDWHLGLGTRTAQATIVAGDGRWVDGTWPSDPPMPIAASGGWRADGSFQADVAFVETPHRMLLSVDPASATFRADWQAFPLHGTDPGDFATP